MGNEGAAPSAAEQIARLAAIAEDYRRRSMSARGTVLDDDKCKGFDEKAAAAQAACVAALRARDAGPAMLSALREIAGTGSGAGRNPQVLVDIARAAIAAATGEA